MQQSTNMRTKPLGFATIKDLTGSGNSLEATVAKLAELLSSSGKKGQLQFRFLEKGNLETAAIHRITLDGKKAAVSQEAAAHPHVEILIESSTWLEIASGRLAPIDAFVRGRMRVRGDTALAQRWLKHVAGSCGRTTLCQGE